MEGGALGGPPRAFLGRNKFPSTTRVCRYEGPAWTIPEGDAPEGWSTKGQATVGPVSPPMLHRGVIRTAYEGREPYRRYG